MVSAVVVAAGSGERLGAGLPKALVELGGRPLVRHAVEALAAAGVAEIVATVPSGHEDAFIDALNGTGARVVTGGAQRQDSVRCGLATLGCGADDVVLVHDAARPLAGADMIRRVVEAVESGAEAVVPGRAISDSLRQVGAAGTRSVDRSALCAVQTPQGFRFATLVSAHGAVADAGLEITDDAAAAEHIGCAVRVVEGDPHAFKITESLDLVLASHLLEVAR